MNATPQTVLAQTLQEALPGFESINRYWDRQRNIVAAKILPGEVYVTPHDELVTTVLGSCVSACIRDNKTGIGGMNHFMLPASSMQGNWELEAGGQSTRYGMYAMEQLINEILKNGASRKDLEVKVFGGGKILAQMTDIGEQNSKFVQTYIRTEGLKLLGQDLGDIYPRKVVYHPRTGKVQVRKLRSMHNNTITEREKDYMEHIQPEQIVGEIDLF